MKSYSSGLDQSNLAGNSQVRPLQKIENGHEAQQTSVQKQAHLSFLFQF